MKSATRMALVTGEMSDCMSGAEPGRAAWGSASVRPSSVRCLSPPAPFFSLAPLATVEDGVWGFTARCHTHLGLDAHAHGLPATRTILLLARKVSGASLMKGGAVCPQIHEVQMLDCRMIVQTQTAVTGL